VVLRELTWMENKEKERRVRIAQIDLKRALLMDWVVLHLQVDALQV